MVKQEVAVGLCDGLGTGYPCSHPWSRHNYCPLPPEDRKRVLHPLPCLDFQSSESSCVQSHAGHPGLPGSHQWSLRLAWQALTLGFGISFSGILSFALHLFFELRGFSCSSQLWQVEPECPGCQCSWRSWRLSRWWGRRWKPGPGWPASGRDPDTCRPRAFISHRSNFQFRSELMKMSEQQNKSCCHFHSNATCITFKFGHHVLPYCLEMSSWHNQLVSSSARFTSITSQQSLLLT